MTFHKRMKPGQLESARSRVALGTVIGLCLSVQGGAAAQTSQIERFTARARAGSLVLTWSVPPVTDVARIVIRFSVDGPAPAAPNAGMALYDELTPPGAVYGTRHARLSPRHSYSYAAFGLNAAGEVVSTTTAVATPLAVQPPATVQNLRRADVPGADSSAASRGPR